MKSVTINPGYYEIFRLHDGREAVISRSAEGVIHPQNKWKIMVLNENRQGKPKTIIRGFPTKKDAVNRLKTI